MTNLLHQILAPIGTLAALATLPGAIELSLVTSGAARRRSAAPPGDLSNFSLAVVVPAHNEEILIGRCVASLLKSAAGVPRCSVVVIADNCTDATELKAQLAGARVLVRHNAEERGKGHALRFAFDKLMADGFDAFLVVDADSMVSDNLIPAMASALLNGAHAAQSRYRVAPPLDSTSKRLMDVALLAFNVLRPKGRDGWGLSAGILGNGFAVSRQTLLEVPYSANSIVEDLEYHLLLIDSGKRVQFVDTAVVYGDMPTDDGAQVSQRSRWEGGRARVALTWIPKLAARLLHGKRLVAEPLLELLTLPLAYLAVLALVLEVLPLPLFRWYGACVIALLAAHVAFAIKVGGNARESVAALAGAPAYVFWKLARLRSIIGSARPGTQWLRTARASDLTGEKPHV